MPMHEHNPVLVATHAQHIYDFDAKPFATPQSPLSVTRAFGARAPEKLVGDLALSMSTVLTVVGSCKADYLAS